MTNLKPSGYMQALTKGLLEHFDANGINQLAFYLHVDWDILPGNEKIQKTISLVKHLAQRGRLGELVTRAREEIPHYKWPDTPPASKQKEDVGQSGELCKV